MRRGEKREAPNSSLPPPLSLSPSSFIPIRRSLLPVSRRPQRNTENYQNLILSRRSIRSIPSNLPCAPAPSLPPPFASLSLSFSLYLFPRFISSRAALFLCPHGMSGGSLWFGGVSCIQNPPRPLISGVARIPQSETDWGTNGRTRRL